jgi:hypothetical protein
LYKAAANATKCLAAPADHKKVCGYDSPIGGFEARAAAVNAEFKLVVNRTFFDIELEDTSSSDDEVQLPEAFFKTTREIDGWRRDYRRFRLGHHQGAKGEMESLTPRSV